MVITMKKDWKSLPPALQHQMIIQIGLALFCLVLAIGALAFVSFTVSIPFIPTEIYKILPYIVTVIVLVLTSMKNSRDKQPPASLGLNYFREER